MGADAFRTGDAGSSKTSRPQRRASDVAVETDSWSAAKKSASVVPTSSDLRQDPDRIREVASMRKHMDAVPMEVRRKAIALASCRITRATGAGMNGPEEITRAIADLKANPAALEACLSGGRQAS